MSLLSLWLKNKASAILLVKGCENMRELLRAVALGKRPADLLIKNAKIVDVLTESVYEAEVVVAEGYIATVVANGTYKDAKKVLDIKGAYLPRTYQCSLSCGVVWSHCNEYCLEELRWGNYINNCILTRLLM